MSAATLAPPPPPPRPVAPPPAVVPSPSPAEIVAPMAARPRSDDDLLGSRLVLEGIPWHVYLALSDAVGDRPAPKLTYDDGCLEFEMPSRLHELLKLVTHDFVTDYLKEFEIDYEPAGSMTLRREEKSGGLEADSSYYIQNYPTVAGKSLPPDVDPPPDLAVEVDLREPGVEKANIYARLGVPEIWRWRDGRLAVLLRQGDGAYVEAERSAALPGFPLARLAEELARVPHAGQAEAGRAFRQWCRDEAARQRAAVPS